MRFCFFKLQYTVTVGFDISIHFFVDSHVFKVEDQCIFSCGVKFVVMW